MPQKGPNILILKTTPGKLQNGPIILANYIVLFVMNYPPDY